MKINGIGIDLNSLYFPKVYLESNLERNYVLRILKVIRKCQNGNE